MLVMCYSININLKMKPSCFIRKYNYISTI